MPHPDAWQQRRSAWLFHIGRRLQAEYEATEAPVPARLARLVQQFEMATKSPGEKGRDWSRHMNPAGFARR